MRIERIRLTLMSPSTSTRVVAANLSMMHETPRHAHERATEQPGRSVLWSPVRTYVYRMCACHDGYTYVGHMLYDIYSFIVVVHYIFIFIQCSMMADDTGTTRHDVRANRASHHHRACCVIIKHRLAIAHLASHRDRHSHTHVHGRPSMRNAAPARQLR